MSEHTLGDGPIQAKYREEMNEVARVLDGYFNGDTKGAAREVGFVLLVFPFGSERNQRCNFISNGADRRAIVVLFKEMIARFEGQPEMKGTA